MSYAPKWTHRFKLKSETWVFVPTADTLKTGKLIKRHVALKWSPPDNYYHLREGGHVDAIKKHVGGKFFIHADLRRFFNQINRTRVTRELRPLFGYALARQYAIESTVPIWVGGDKKYVLPFGFVQSTLIASLCLYKSKLGRVLRELEKTPGVSVSVYMDDILISTQELAVAETALEYVRNASERSGLPLNEAKLEGPADQVTAFNIRLNEFSVRLTSKRIDEFKLGYIEAASEKQRLGILSYVEAVNPAQVHDVKT